MVSNMYGINAKLPKEFFECYMCKARALSHSYIWGNFAILPEHPYTEHRICKKCAQREVGSKNKKKLDDNIVRRTEEWLNRKQSG